MLINYGNEPFDEEVSIAEFILEEIEDINFDHEIINKTIYRAAEMVAHGKPLEPDHFIGPHDPQMSQLVIDLLEMKYFVSEGWQKKHKIITLHESEDLPDAAYKMVLRLKKKKLEILIEQNDLALKSTSDIDEQMELLKVHKHLKDLLVEVDTELGIVVPR
jgi:DNA primase